MTPALIEGGVLAALLLIFLVLVLDIWHKVRRIDLELGRPLPLPPEPELAPAPTVTSPSAPTVAPPPTPPQRPTRPSHVSSLIFMDRDLKVEFERKPWNRQGAPFSDETRTTSFKLYDTYFHLVGQDILGNWIYRQGENA